MERLLRDTRAFLVYCLSYLGPCPTLSIMRIAFTKRLTKKGPIAMPVGARLTIQAVYEFAKSKGATDIVKRATRRTLTTIPDLPPTFPLIECASTSLKTGLGALAGAYIIGDTPSSVRSTKADLSTCIHTLFPERGVTGGCGPTCTMARSVFLWNG